MGSGSATITHPLAVNAYPVFHQFLALLVQERQAGRRRNKKNNDRYKMTNYLMPAVILY